MTISIRILCLFVLLLTALPAPAVDDLQTARFPALGFTLDFPAHWTVVNYETDGGPSQDRVFTATSSRDRQSLECNYMKMLPEGRPETDEDRDELLHSALRSLLQADVNYRSSMDGPFVRTTGGLRNILARVASENPAYDGNIAVFHLIVSGDYFLLCKGFNRPGDDGGITAIVESLSKPEADQTSSSMSE